MGHTYMLGTPLAHVALSGVDMRVMPGKAHALIGATGSGKSTLLQHLNGLLRPQQGSVRVGGLDLADPDLPTRKVTHIAGLVMQNPEMQFFEQYVGDEVAYGLNKSASTNRWPSACVGLWKWSVWTSKASKIGLPTP